MLILGIESSCDETAAAVVQDGRTVLSSLISSQIAVHQTFGGVVPEIAAREHLKAIDPIVQEALRQAGKTIQDCDAIAITQGPGLIGSLLVGIAYAKGLSLVSGKPLIPVDHVHAHVHGALLGLKDNVETLFPSLALVVSGGHTNLYYMRTPIDFELIACSIDDACGESFDKVAKLFQLGYPGGPVIEKMAKGGDPRAIAMPRMVKEKDRLEFSYSGLKTHMVNLKNREGASITPERLRDVCASFQEEAMGQIVRKLARAVELKPDTRSVLIAGGVAANERLRAMLREGLRVPSYFPELRFCSDNAAMIAAYGYHLCKRQGLPAGTSAEWDAYSRYAFPA